MIVDSSALMAIILNESEGADFADLLLTDRFSRMAAGTWIELAAVLSRRVDHAELFPILDGIVENLHLEIAPMTVAQSEIGHRAYREFGRGTQHPAQLNFGDCFPYALAIAMDEPLLFKGDDFVHTDVMQAVPR